MRLTMVVNRRAVRMRRQRYQSCCPSRSGGLYNDQRQAGSSNFGVRENRNPMTTRRDSLVPNRLLPEVERYQVDLRMQVFWI